MSHCKPYGNVKRAKILVIGHDPRLQRSEAQAQYAFFLDCLEQPIPKPYPERRKYGLASSAVAYIKHLAGRFISLEAIYFTNLCNEFLCHPYGSGTVFIPEDHADRGIDAIEDALSQGSFKVILPMTPQVFYHLVRTGFVADSSEEVISFLRRARASPTASARKAYDPVGRSPFLTVCGQKYHHRNDLTPVIPVLHVKQWPLNSRMRPHYGCLMEMATRNIRLCLRSATVRNGACQTPSK